MKKILLLSLATLSLSTGHVLAQDTATDTKKPHRGMHKIDSNGDGIVTKSEFLKHAESRFSRIDKDGSGDISKDERRAAHDAMRDRKKDFIEKRKEKREDRQENRRENRPDASSDEQ